MDEQYLKAQYAVLGSVLIKPELAPQVLFELSPNDFEGPCKTLFSRLDDMFGDGKPIDIITVAEGMGREYIGFIKELMDTTPTTANLPEYIRIVRQKAQLRDLREIGELLSAVGDVAEAESIMEKANGIMVGTRKNRGWTLADLLLDFGRRMEQPAEHLPWPIPGMENMVRVRRGHFIMLVAEPSAGKTAFALQCAAGWAEKHKVGFFSLEMGREDVTDRIVARSASIDYSIIQDHAFDEAAYDKFNATADAIAPRTLKVYEANGFTVADIKATALVDRLDIIILDYAQLLAGKGNNPYEVQTAISMALHNLALSTKTIVLALAQVSRSGLANDKLSMHDIKGTGQWEQDADVILLMSLLEKGNRFSPRYLEIGKNRNGPAGYAYLDFIGKLQRFSKMPESTARQWLADRQAARKAKKEKGVLENERFC